MRVLSLGGGVQSSVLALMADRGEFGPKPDVAIHADTQADPPETLAMVRWLAETVSYPVHIVTAGDLGAHVARAENTSGNTYVVIPAHTVNEDQTHGLGRRQCTREFKIRPLEQEQRRLLGVAPGKRVPAGTTVEVWLGISWDETQRMKDPRTKWQTNRWPLIERRMTRADCLTWWEANAPGDGPELHRSACVFCPLRSSETWIDIADRHPDLIEQAAETEKSMQQNDPDPGRKFFHHRRIPLLEAIAEDRRIKTSQPELDLWDNECEGMCGV